MYTPLYIKTNNSILSSIIKIDELINYAKTLGLKSLTITDDSMYGTIDFYKACIKENIKPVIGLEIEYNGKVVLYAANKEGYNNLIKLSTIKTEKQLDLNDLKEHSKGLICILPSTSRNNYETLKNIYEDTYNSYRTPKERCENSVFMNEILYLKKEEEEYLHYLLAIKYGKNVNDIKIETKNNYLVKPEKLKSLPEEDLKRNEEIINKCNLEIGHTENLLIKVDCEDSFKELKKECIKGMKRLFGNTVNKVYVERLKHELEVINKMGFCDYFLVVADFINYAKNNNIYIGPGRGSAAGSLVAYLLNITQIDPIKYNLFFERFLNIERKTMPDIDVDIEDSKREEVLKYCINKYGIKRVVPIIVFGTMKTKQAIRDVARTMGLDQNTVEYISKRLNSELTIKENLAKNEELQEYIRLDKQLIKLFEVASTFENLKRTTSVHPSGVIMSSVDIDTVVPLDKSHKDFYTTSFDMTYLEELGLLKMDFLSLKNLSTIHNIIDDIDNGLTLDSIPDNDKEALEIFENVDTMGIFQFEGEGMTKFLRKFRPNTFEDIFAAIALYRPGSMNFIDTYINRKQGKEKINYIDKSLETILKPTYGVIIYQEQVMQVAQIFAGYKAGEADLLRRAMSKKKESLILEQKEKFISQSINQGHSKELSNEVYEMILKFASYGFNRSHSVAYSLVAYKQAYLKAHYRPYFMKNLLNSTSVTDIKIKDYIYDLKNHGIKLILPNINYSGLQFTVKDNTIIYPLNGIKGVGINACLTIIKEREKQEFKDIFDFFKRCYSKSVNRKTIENLILAGAFDSFYNRNTLMSNIEELVNYGEVSDGLDFDITPELIIKEEYSTKDLLDLELEVIGFYLSKHPVTEYINQTHTQLSNLIKGKTAKTVVLIDRINEITTKKNENMAFLTGSDEQNTIELVMFPSTYKENKELRIGNIVEVNTKVDLRNEKLQLVINDLKVLS
ncbi:MAG: DNA polymerase III subunit alpha [Bacilli bacterium]